MSPPPLCGEASIEVLLADPAKVAAVEPERVPGLLLEVAARRQALDALQAALVARALFGPTAEARKEDRLLKVEEAAERLGTTEGWLYRHSKRLPFVVRPGRGQLRFSLKSIDDYIRTGRGA